MNALAIFDLLCKAFKIIGLVLLMIFVNNLDHSVKAKYDRTNGQTAVPAQTGRQPAPIR
jgi:hypothetical protein